MSLDAATGLYHVRARTYDARTGRFTSRDPIETNVRRPESQNPYVFALNNPIRWADPNGENALLLETVVIAAVVAIIAATALHITGQATLNYLNRARPTLGPSQDESTGTQPRPREQRPPPLGPDIDIGRDETNPERWDIWRADIVRGQPDLRFSGPISDWTAIGWLMGAPPKRGSSPFASRNVWASTGRRVLEVAPWPTLGPEIDRADRYLDEDGDYKDGSVRYCHFHDANRAWNAHLFFGPYHRRPLTDPAACLGY